MKVCTPGTVSEILKNSDENRVDDVPGPEVTVWSLNDWFPQRKGHTDEHDRRPGRQHADHENRRPPAERTWHLGHPACRQHFPPARGTRDGAKPDSSAAGLRGG